MAEDVIDPPNGWATPPPFEAGGMRWHRYRYRPTEGVTIEVRLGEALSPERSDTFTLHLSMRLADRGPVTHDFEVASYEEFTDARRATESLLDRLADEVFDAEPVARVQDAIGDLVDETTRSGGVLERLFRLVLGG